MCAPLCSLCGAVLILGVLFIAIIPHLRSERAQYRISQCVISNLTLQDIPECRLESCSCRSLLFLIDQPLCDLTKAAAPTEACRESTLCCLFSHCDNEDDGVHSSSHEPESKPSAPFNPDRTLSEEDKTAAREHATFHPTSHPEALLTYNYPCNCHCISYGQHQCRKVCGHRTRYDFFVSLMEQEAWVFLHRHRECDMKDLSCMKRTRLDYANGTVMPCYYNSDTQKLEMDIPYEISWVLTWIVVAAVGVWAAVSTCLLCDFKTDASFPLLPSSIPTYGST